MSQLQVQIETRLAINISAFKQDFLDIEVDKKYSIYGDDLVERMSEHYKEDAKNHGDLFTDKYIYDCRGVVEDKVLLIGHRVNWR